ncbi:class I SAM-dependent methyltransferase [Skermanella mucosa]|uniref:class I SAM-dependent methyltransferase n=1 Tax=Skermanella mucosa TaxID=1789672 RepID=UPI00192AC952|nr:class I SAM-dependent methyltransferase [Skermanella mucosa]UEM23330.1 class I SAM-dependent methyltransferase [Skermanella mucosa]
MSYEKYERIAPLYDVLDKAYEVSWKRRLRNDVFRDAGGMVLDAGAGTGCNIPFYPRNARVIGVDNSPGMLVRARKRAAKEGVAAEFLEMDLTRTRFPDNHFDVIAATFVFCVLPEELQLPVLREMHRICKPTGTIRILDYTMSKKAPVRLMMRVVSPWLNFAFAARYTAQYESYLPEARLTPVRNDFVMGDVVKLLVLSPEGKQTENASQREFAALRRG